MVSKTDDSQGELERLNLAKASQHLLPIAVSHPQEGKEGPTNEG